MWATQSYPTNSIAWLQKTTFAKYKSQPKIKIIIFCTLNNFKDGKDLIFRSAIMRKRMRAGHGSAIRRIRSLL
jgi:hypothetical protein